MPTITPITQLTQYVSTTWSGFIYPTSETYVDSSLAKANFNSDAVISVGYFSDTNAIYRGLMLFDLAPIPSGIRTITDAKLALNLSLESESAQEARVQLYSGTVDYDTVHWDDQPTILSAPVVTFTLPISGYNTTATLVNIKTLVQSVVDALGVNDLGLVLRRTTESGTSGAADYYTSEGADEYGAVFDPYLYLSATSRQQISGSISLKSYGSTFSTASLSGSYVDGFNRPGYIIYDIVDDVRRVQVVNRHDDSVAFSFISGGATNAPQQILRNTRSQISLANLPGIGSYNIEFLDVNGSLIGRSEADFQKSGSYAIRSDKNDAGGWNSRTETLVETDRGATVTHESGTTVSITQSGRRVVNNKVGRLNVTSRATSRGATIINNQ